MIGLPIHIAKLLLVQTCFILKLELFSEKQLATGLVQGSDFRPRMQREREQPYGNKNNTSSHSYTLVQSSKQRTKRRERERDDEALATDWPAGRSGTADTFGSPPDQCAC